MNEAQTIAENQVKSASTGELVTTQSFWGNQDCVVVFFRRFGCQFCRLAARQLSEIKPKLDEHNVRLVGIGVEDLGVKEFIEGNFFAGDLFIDVGKKCYKDLHYKRYGYLNLFPALFVKSSRHALAESRAAHLGGDFKGDYYQVGGTFVVKKGGEQVLLSHRMVALADHVENEEVLKCLNIS